VREVPGAPVWIIGEVSGKRAVSPALVTARGQLHDSGADQRMAEHEMTGVLRHADQPRLFRGREVVDFLLSAGGGLLDPEVAMALKHGEQEQVPGGRGQVGRPRREQRMEALAERQRHGQCLKRGALRAAQLGLQFKQGKRIPLGLRQHPLTYPRGEPGEPSVEQARRCPVRQGAHLMGRKVTAIEEAVAAGPRRGEEADTAAGQAASDEAEHEAARPVHPRQVVDDHKQRRGGGGFLAAQLVIQADALNLLVSAISIPDWIAILAVPVLILTIYGYDWIHRWQRLMTVVLAITFVAIFVQAIDHGGLTGPAAGTRAPSFALFMVATGIYVISMVSWAPYVSDYSRYLPETVSKGRTFWAVFLGCAIPAIFCSILGAYITGLLPHAP
jgi:hypothetical protein